MQKIVSAAHLDYVICMIADTKNQVTGSNPYMAIERLGHKPKCSGITIPSFSQRTKT